MVGSMCAHVLVAEDDVRQATVIRRYLEREGHTALVVHDGRAAIDEARRRPPDLLVLDVMMPGESGFDFAQSLRAGSNVPILMLTARDAAESRIKGLEMGADDYLSKPFEPRELSLRIANILKRTQPAAAPPVESVRFGPFVYHLARGELRKGEEVIRLTDRERDMLRVLAATPGETVPRMALAGDGGSAGERAVDVQINRLRRKIERNPANPLYVQTVRGIGYRLVTAS